HTTALDNCFKGKTNGLTSSTNNGNRDRVTVGPTSLPTQQEQSCADGDNNYSNTVSAILLSDIYEILVLDEAGRIVPISNLSDPTVLGLPINNNTVNAADLDLNRISCQYYDRNEEIWKSNGCHVEVSNTGQISCACDHLTP